jgi:hypothetical protein
VSGYTNAGVRMVYFNYNCHHIHTVPRNLHVFFPNILGISLNRCGVSSLTGNELYNYRYLQYFAMHENGLARVPGDLFILNPGIRVVMFDNNKITQVGANLLDSVQANLLDVRFLNNVCISQDGNTAATISSLLVAVRIYCPDNRSSDTDVPVEDMENNLWNNFFYVNLF